MSDKLIYLGCERYLERRVITHEHHYYACGDKLEVRHKTNFSDHWFVTRYLNVSDETMKIVAGKLDKMGDKVRSNSKAHNELDMLLRPPWARGFIEFGEEDSPDRKVVISSVANIPPSWKDIDPVEFFAFEMVAE